MPGLLSIYIQNFSSIKKSYKSHKNYVTVCFKLFFAKKDFLRCFLMCF